MERLEGLEVKEGYSISYSVVTEHFLPTVLNSVHTSIHTLSTLLQRTDSNDSLTNTSTNRLVSPPGQPTDLPHQSSRSESGHLPLCRHPVDCPPLRCLRCEPLQTSLSVSATCSTE